MDTIGFHPPLKIGKLGSCPPWDTPATREPQMEGTGCLLFLNPGSQCWSFISLFVNIYETFNDIKASLTFTGVMSSL